MAGSSRPLRPTACLQILSRRNILKGCERNARKKLTGRRGAPAPQLDPKLGPTSAPYRCS
jgi:hypothetical protein